MMSKRHQMSGIAHKSFSFFVFQFIISHGNVNDLWSAKLELTWPFLFIKLGILIRAQAMHKTQSVWKFSTHAGRNTFGMTFQQAAV